MLLVKVALENHRDIHFPETMFDCPNCGFFVKFYSICPQRCQNCLKVLPDARTMEMMRSARLDYYKGGYGDP